jgi:hypothetical protein
MPLRCALVVDRASVEAKLASVLGRRRWPALDVAKAVAWFQSAGLDPVEVAVAGPIDPILGATSEPFRARRTSDEHRGWMMEQRAGLDRAAPGVRFRSLAGATDGVGEVGVDVAAAAGALDAVSRSVEDDIDLVVLMTTDSDFHNLHKYAAPFPLLVAGVFQGDELHRVKQTGAPAIHIAAKDFATFSVSNGRVRCAVKVSERGSRPLPPEIGNVRKGDLVLVADDGSDEVCSGPLDRAVRSSVPVANEVLSRCRTVVCVDPYGMFNASVRALGAGRLPNIDSVRALVWSLGWDEPLALLAKIPDVLRHGRPTAPAARAAWESRDTNLDDVANEYARDQDPATGADRAPLRVDRIKRPESDHLDRAAALRAAKGLAVGLLADLWLARTSAPEADVVLLSEHPDLHAALRLMPTSGIETYEQVVVVGLHEPERLGGNEAVPFPFVLLTDWQLAGLCRVDDELFGGSHRRFLLQAVRARTRPTIEGVDPETLADIVLLRAYFDVDGDGAQEVRSARTLLLPPLGEDSGSTSLDNVTVVVDPVSPCSHPVLRYRSSDLSTVEGVVVDQSGNWVSVDVDGDGKGDLSVPVGHEALDFEPGTDVVVGLAGDGRFLLADPGNAASDPLEPVVVQVTGMALPYWTVTPGEDVEQGQLVSVGGSPALSCLMGDYLFALRRETAEGCEYVAMSSALVHLKRMNE